jgi:FKBP-type peptidyl-prolyl cis-trans isomerase FkpA
MKRGNGIYTLLTIGLILVTGLSSCGNIEKEMREEEQALIKAYIEKNNVTVEPTATGLYYLEITPGTGSMPINGDTVGVYYKTKFLNGFILDQHLEGVPYRFKLGNQESIPGIEEGIKLMRLFGKANLLIPSSQAYGRTGYLAVPGYTPLLIEVELVSISPGLKK